MKSFSFKALALACVVVAGSANAGIIDTVNTKLFGSSTTYVDIDGKLVKLEKAIELFPQMDFSKAEKTIRYHNNGAINTAKKSFEKATNAADKTLFGEFVPSNVFDNDDAQGEIQGGILPKFLYFNNGYKRAAFAVVATAAITAAVVKAYKYFTKPAADATEGENIEANEANTVA